MNAVKHGKAQLIEIRLAAAGDHGCVLSVQDNGVGLVRAPGKGRGMGIAIMKYRARMIGAEVQVRPRAGGGTEVLCRYACEVQPQPSLMAASSSSRG